MPNSFSVHQNSCSCSLQSRVDIEVPSARSIIAFNKITFVQRTRPQVLQLSTIESAGISAQVLSMFSFISGKGDDHTSKRDLIYKIQI